MRLRIKYRDWPAVVVHRAAFKNKKLVYVGRANRRYRYPWGRSRIVYIGTTGNGASHVASSAAKKGEDLLFEHGIKEVEFSVVTLWKVATCRHLEKIRKRTIDQIPRKVWCSSARQFPGEEDTVEQ